MENIHRRIETYLGLAVYGSVGVGIIGLAAALISLIMGQYIGAGLFLMSSALSFGLLSVALIRT
jgi:hypothetical protein